MICIFEYIYSCNIISEGKEYVEYLFLHKLINERIMLVIFSRLGHVLLNGLNQFGADKGHVVSGDT